MEALGSRGVAELMAQVPKGCNGKLTWEVTSAGSSSGSSEKDTRTEPTRDSPPPAPPADTSVGGSSPPKPPPPVSTAGGPGGDGGGRKPRSRFVRLMDMRSSFWFWVIAVALVFLVLAAILAVQDQTEVKKYIGFNMGLYLLLLVVIYVVMSFREVEGDELGVRVILGRPIDNLESGPAFIPRRIGKLIRLPGTVGNIEIPAEPELIYRAPKGPDGKVHDDTLPEDKLRLGYRPPIRVTFDGKAGSDDPLEQRITTEVAPVLRRRITDGVEFIRTFGSLAEFNKQVEDVTVAFCNENLSTLTLKEARKDLAKVNRGLTESVQRQLQKGGIEIESVVIKQIPLFRDLNVAIDSGAVETGLANGAIAKAKGTKESIRLKGEGEAAAREAFLNAETAAFTKRGKDLDVTGREVLSAETIGLAAKGNLVIAGDQGFTQLAGLGATLATTFNKLPKPTPSAEPPAPASS